MFAKEAEAIRLTKNEVPTPALVVDLDLLESNLRAMADHCRKTGKGFRPHAKTHKCPEIARRQMSAGALGISVATVSEAEAMIRAGIRGVLLTSPIMEPRKIARMVELETQVQASRGSKAPSDSKSNDAPGVMLSIGHVKQVQLLAEAANAKKLTVNVLIDLDVGDRRTGTLPGPSALELANVIAKHSNLKLWGVQAYSGRASHTMGFEARKEVSQTAMGKAVETRAKLAQAGFQAPILSGGSTGTYNIDAELDGVTELQVGSYVFMDMDYRRIGGKNGPTYTDFQHSLTVLTTVVSATHADRVTVDAGTKAFATDVIYKPEAKNYPGIVYDRGGDEFGILTTSGGKLPQLGDRLEFFVPHCDPTVNLYDRIYVVRGEQVEGVWPVVARKE